MKKQDRLLNQGVNRFKGRNLGISRSADPQWEGEGWTKRFELRIGEEEQKVFNYMRRKFGLSRAATVRLALGLLRHQHKLDD